MQRLLERSTVRVPAWRIMAERKTGSDEHDDPGHYCYVERCGDHINHNKRSLSTNDGLAPT
jgi:hypothetical protein